MTNSTRSPRLATLESLSAASTIEHAGDHGDRLGALRLAEHAIEYARRGVIEDARADGWTWQQIGDALGTTRQNAQQRYGR